MTLHILETDTLSLYQRGHPLVCQKVTARSSDEIGLAVISVEEQLTGWYTRLRKAKKRSELAAVYLRFTNAICLLSQFNVLTFSEEAIVRYEALRETYRGIGKNDLRIAAIALEHNATVVTRNRTDFGRIPGLTIEDWSQ